MVSDAIDWFTDDVLGFDPPPGSDVTPGQLLDQQANYSFVNQISPYGKLTYDQTADGQMRQRYRESDFQKWLRQGQEDITANLLGNAQTQVGNLPTAPMNMDNAQAWGAVPTAGQGMNLDPNDYGQAVFDYQMTLAQPYWDQNDARFSQGLVNQGLDPTGELAQRMTTQYGDQRARDLQQMQNAALTQSLGAQQQMFGQGMDSAKLANMTRQAQMGEQQGLRNQQLGEIGTLLGMQQQQPVSPGFFGPSGIPNVSGAYQTAQQGYAAGQQNQNDLLGNLGAAGQWLWDLL